MQMFVLIVMISVLMIVDPARAEAPGKWIKGAPFPEPSEELVGGSVGGQEGTAVTPGFLGVSPRFL